MSPIPAKAADDRTALRLRAYLRGGAVVAALAAGGFAVFASSEPARIQPAAGGDPVGPVVKLLAGPEVATLALLDLRDTLALSGEVVPVQRATISAQVSGIAGQVTRLPGESLGAGDLLLTIAPEDYRLTLQLAEADLARLTAQIKTADTELDRATRLAARGAASTAALDTAQATRDGLLAEIAAAQTRVRQAGVNLDRASVRAPFAGVLAGRSVEPGQLVQPGDPLFDLVDLSRVTVEASVPLTYAAALVVGQKAVFWPPEDQSHRIAATVARVSPQAVAGTRSARVYLEIDNSAGGLRGGTFLTGEVELRRAVDRLAVPRGAIRGGNGKGDGSDGTGSVLAIRDGRAVLVPVTTGREWRGGSLIEITSGLVAGDQIVALPLTGLDPGDRVALADN